jgi:excisionase family DNA binding protein
VTVSTVETMNAYQDRTLLSTAEAAAYLGCSARTLGACWRKWGLRPYRVGKHNMYRVRDLEHLASVQASTNRCSSLTHPAGISCAARCTATNGIAAASWPRDRLT